MEDSHSHNGSDCDGWCEGGFEIFMVAMTFSLGLPILLCLWCYCTKKSDQENSTTRNQILEMIERQDQVIKTYQKAKMIISGTAFESLQLTILQTRLHFVCISEYTVVCLKSGLACVRFFCEIPYFLEKSCF